MLELSSSIDDALTRYPMLAILFMRHHMICVGCDIARFHTVQEAAQMYAMDPVELLSEMRTMVETKSTTSSDGDIDPVQ